MQADSLTGQSKQDQKWQEMTKMGTRFLTRSVMGESEPGGVRCLSSPTQSGPPRDAAAECLSFSAFQVYK